MATYAILIYEGVEPIDVGATFGVLSMARRILPDLSFFAVARSAGPVVCANGLTVLAHHGYADCPEHDRLVVTGGPGWAAAGRDPATIAFLARTGGQTAALCTGAMILASAGRLDGCEATTKSAVFPGEIPALATLAERHPAVRTRSAAIVDSAGVVTTGGVTLGIDGMLYLLERDYGAAAAAEVARVMEYARAYAANRSALGHHVAG